MISKPIALLACCLFLFLAAPSAGAEEVKLNIQKEQVDQISKKVYDDLIDRTKKREGAAGTLMGASFIYPPFEYAVLKSQIDRGYLSGFASLCGMNWQAEIYEPYMVFIVKMYGSRDKESFAVQYARDMHNVSMDLVTTQMKAEDICTDQFKANLLETVEARKAGDVDALERDAREAERRRLEREKPWWKKILGL